MVARQATTCRKGERVGTIERAFCASEDAGPHRRNVTASSTRHLGPFGLRVSMRSARASGLRAPRCEQGDEGLGGFVGGHICLRSGASSETFFGRGRRTKKEEAAFRFWFIFTHKLKIAFIFSICLKRDHFWQGAKNQEPCVPHSFISGKYPTLLVQL